MNEIDGVELACVSNMESDTVYRLFRKDGRVWVRAWVHFRPRVEGIKQASAYELHADNFGNVIMPNGKTLKSVVDAKLIEIDSH